MQGEAVNSDQKKEITVKANNRTQLKGERHDKHQRGTLCNYFPLTAAMGACRAARRANANVKNQISQGLGLTAIYATSAWPRNFHMVANILIMQWINFP